MRIIQIVLLGFVLVSDIAIFIWDWKLSRKVFYGQISSFHKQLEVSILGGISVSLLFISIALLLGIMDTSYVWTISSAFSVIIIALIIGILAVIGTILSFFLTGKFRSKLFTKMKNKK